MGSSGSTTSKYSAYRNFKGSVRNKVVENDNEDNKTANKSKRGRGRSFKSSDGGSSKTYKFENEGKQFTNQ
jgi:hypothetical protein